MNDRRKGLDELRAARRSGGLFPAVVLFSILVNLLMLTSPLYMLQVYDRVLTSRSQETLIALSLIVVVLFIAMGLFDNARGRIMARIAARFQDRLDRRVFRAASRRLTIAPADPLALPAGRDLEAVQRYLASPVMMALVDLPWTPLFVTAIFIFHPWLGWLAIGGGLLLVAITLVNKWLSREPVSKQAGAALAAERMAENLSSEAETLQALGMVTAAQVRLSRLRHEALELATQAGDVTGRFGTLSKTLRMFLQSSVLGLGAWLVLKGELSAGAMIAASILLGRALAPVEQLVSQWSVAERAREGWTRLSTLLTLERPDVERTELPRPKAILDVNNLSVVPPGEAAPTLRGVTFRLEAGQALGVIGPSGAGKSTLARALTGVWRPATGRIRLDGATLDQYDPDVLGSLIGYLPQRVVLFDGTIKENIARLSPEPDDTRAVEAAKAAAAHEMILRLPQGYDTPVGSAGGRLSGGQVQRIGLARALYGDPVLLVLDEANSNLDNDGTVALNEAIRTVKARGGSVLVMAHRPAAIQECDMLMVLGEGAVRAFGPRDKVLRDMVQNHSQIVRSATPGGVA